jgi:hypothetical protein
VAVGRVKGRRRKERKEKEEERSGGQQREWRKKEENNVRLFNKGLNYKSNLSRTSFFFSF